MTTALSVWQGVVITRNKRNKRGISTSLTQSVHANRFRNLLIAHNKSKHRFHIETVCFSLQTCLSGDSGESLLHMLMTPAKGLLFHHLHQPGSSKLRQQQQQHRCQRQHLLIWHKWTKAVVRSLCVEHRHFWQEPLAFGFCSSSASSNCPSTSSATFVLD